MAQCLVVVILDLASPYCQTVPGPVLLLPGAKISYIGKWGLTSNKKQFGEMVLTSAVVRVNYCINAAICGSLASIATHFGTAENRYDGFIPLYTCTT